MWVFQGGRKTFKTPQDASLSGAAKISLRQLIFQPGFSSSIIHITCGREEFTSQDVQQFLVLEIPLFGNGVGRGTTDTVVEGVESLLEVQIGEAFEGYECRGKEREDSIKEEVVLQGSGRGYGLGYDKLTAHSMQIGGAIRGNLVFAHIVVFHMQAWVNSKFLVFTTGWVINNLATFIKRIIHWFGYDTLA